MENEELKEAVEKFKKEGVPDWVATIFAFALLGDSFDKSSLNTIFDIYNKKEEVENDEPYATNGNDTEFPKPYGNDTTDVR